MNEAWKSLANGYANNLKAPSISLCNKSLFVAMVPCIKKECECWQNYRADKQRADAEKAG